MRDLRLDRLAHATDEHRQPEADRDGVTISIKQPDREVERLVNDHIVSSPHQISLHLLRCGDEAIADNFSDDGIDALCHDWTSTLMSRFPSRSTVSTSPGASTVVEAYS